MTERTIIFCFATAAVGAVLVAQGLTRGDHGAGFCDSRQAGQAARSRQERQERQVARSAGRDGEIPALPGSAAPTAACRMEHGRPGLFTRARALTQTTVENAALGPRSSRTSSALAIRAREEREAAGRLADTGGLEEGRGRRGEREEWWRGGVCERRGGVAGCKGERVEWWRGGV
jgi:hypothetical protein